MPNIRSSVWRNKLLVRYEVFLTIKNFLMLDGGGRIWKIQNWLAFVELMNKNSVTPY